MNWNRCFRAVLTITAAWITSDPTAWAQATIARTDFTALSIDELLSVRITSVSKKSESLLEAAAAIHVVDREDLMRTSGASLPEVLRGVPGMNVSQIDSLYWGISARGFNDISSNKLLVLIDGRTVYSPLFSGVFWPEQDVVLEDTERIEVIRGPGATLWGANAVNGVINITTKSAKDTLGTQISAGVGSYLKTFASVRHGFQVAPNTYMRVYAKTVDRAATLDATGAYNGDAWHSSLGGFRLDREENDGTTYTLQGDVRHYTSAYRSTFSSITPPYLSIRPDDLAHTGTNLLGRWSRPLDADSEIRVQAYYDHARFTREKLGSKTDIFDLDTQYRHLWGDRHEVVVGGGYRLIRDDLTSSFEYQFTPARDTNRLFNIFAQDEVQLIPSRLHVIGGIKAEHNDYTGWEMQPSLRVSGRIDERQAVWASVAHAVRTPSRSERTAQIVLQTMPPNPPYVPLPTSVALVSSPNFGSETLTAYEIGYRLQTSQRWSLDLTAYVNDYADLRTFETDPVPTVVPVPVPYFQIANTSANKMHGNTAGAEASFVWQATSNWRLKGSYTYLRYDLRTDADSLDVTSLPGIVGNTPRHQFSVTSFNDVTSHVALTTTARFTDELPGAVIPSYLALDMRLAWRATEGLELSIGGQDLLRSSHPEILANFYSTGASAIERSWYAKVLWRF